MSPIFDSIYSVDDFVQPSLRPGDEPARREAGLVHARNAPGFTPGTAIATLTGARRVEDLRAGDRVLTRDNGFRTIRWLGSHALSARKLAVRPHLGPVLIRAGALGDGVPERDMMVSPNHRMLVANDRTALYFEDREVLVPARHLKSRGRVDTAAIAGVTYINFMFVQHEIVLSDGAWSESFQPGNQSLGGIGDAQRREIFDLFPDLETRRGRERYPAARRSLRKHEAALLA